MIDGNDDDQTKKDSKENGLLKDNLEENSNIVTRNSTRDIVEELNMGYD